MGSLVGNSPGFGPKDSVTKDNIKDAYSGGTAALLKLLGGAPTGTPSLADPSVQAARQSQLLTQQLARGRKSTFGAPNPTSLDAAPVTDKTLLGG